MRKIIVVSMLTLDGVIQAPGGTKEDEAEGFKYGGWSEPYGDEVFGKEMQKELTLPADYLLGRRTFEIWEAYWPHHGDYWPGINEGTKYVLSTTRNETDWKGSVFVKSLDDIKKLKASEGRDIQVWGSSQLVQALLTADLVDELRLKIYPVVLGKGKKLFNDSAAPGAFTLIDNMVTPKGVVIASYKRAGEVATGDIKA